MADIYVPKTVYKYMKPMYLKMLEENKEFYINHLSNYIEEKLGSEIGDNNEGTLTRFVQPENYTVGSRENIEFENMLANMGAIVTEGSSRVVVDGARFSQKIVDRNFYNYCVCTEYDEKVKREFGGATLLINDFPKFLTCLNDAVMKDRFDYFIAQECIYIEDRQQTFTEKEKDFLLNHPALVKEKSYSYQKEFRVLYGPNPTEKYYSPLNIYCPEALKYCSFHYN